MDAQVFGILFVLPMVLLIEAGVVRYLWQGQRPGGHFLPGGVEKAMTSLSHNWSGIAVILLMWLVLTLIAWAYEFVFGLVLLNLVLFSLGRIAAGVGLVVFAAVLTLTPVVLARLALKLAHHKTTTATKLPGVRV